MIRIYSVSRTSFSNRFLTTYKTVRNKVNHGKGHWQIIRWQSTNPQSSGKGNVKVLLLGSGALGLGVGGVVAYASYDPSFRKNVEDSIPYSNSFLEFILGPLKEESPLPPPLPNLRPVKPPEPAKPIKEPVKESPAKKPVEAPPAPPPPPPSPPPPPPPVEKITPIAPPAEKPKPEKPSQLDVEAIAAKDRAANRMLSEKLEKFQTKLISLTEEAVRSQKTAADAIKSHVEKVYSATEDAFASENTAAWTEVKNAAEVKYRAIKNASSKAGKVRELADSIRKTLEEARAAKATESNSLLIPTEERISKMLTELELAESKVKQIEGEERVLQEYRKAVTEARRQLQAEVSGIAPDMKVGELASRLTEEELNQLLLHAHKKAIHLQKQLAKQETLDQLQLKHVVEKQKLEDYKDAEARLKTQVEYVQRDMELSYQKKLEAAREQLERELQQQLKRQAAAFSEHEKDIVAAQEVELNRLWEERLRQALYNEQTGFRAKIGQATARVKGINEALKARAELERKAEKAQEMWLASQSLNDAIKLGPKDAYGWENKICSLQNEIKAITSISESAGEVPQAILSSVPTVALERGVYTRDALKERWNSVAQACRKLALVGDEGGSIWRRLISSVQGSLYISNFVAPPTEERSDNPVDMEKLNTYEILDRVRYCLDQDNFEQAVRYLNLLDGAPRQAASDWLAEARLHLETAQAASALLAYASKLSAESLLR